MIKISVLYPNSKDTRFDMEYYCNRHTQMVRKLVGSALRGVSVDQGLSGGAGFSRALCRYRSSSVRFSRSLSDKLWPARAGNHE
jgi:uncharacterized protein (TIGR02118 family)